MGGVQVRTKGVVVDFPAPALRPPRPGPSADEPRGKILLYMGVRYERLPERGPEPSKPRLSDGPGRTSRRRRRS